MPGTALRVETWVLFPHSPAGRPLTVGKGAAVIASLGWTDSTGHHVLYQYKSFHHSSCSDSQPVICKLYFMQTLFNLCNVLCDNFSSCLKFFQGRNENLRSCEVRSHRFGESGSFYCSQSLLFISSEYPPSAGLSVCCFLPPNPASNVCPSCSLQGSPHPSALLPWNQAHRHLGVQSAHFGDRMKRMV